LAARALEHIHTIWTSGTIACVLVTKHKPTRYYVQVCIDEQPMVTRRVADADEAATLGEHFWTEYGEGRRRIRKTNPKPKPRR
jgi:hypothetical protein